MSAQELIYQAAEIKIHSGQETNRLFEQEYIRLRSREGRIYADTELKQLPEITATHRYAGEWKIRKRSATKLRKYFQQKKSACHILEPGCGNGWLTNFLAQDRRHTITGADINETELLQAKRVFGNQPNLRFINGSLDHPVLSKEKYDAIVFASSIQYFESLHEVIRQCITLLKPGGELHLLDSPFYQQQELAAARERTKRYFDESGVPGMTAYYFHHSWEELAGLSYTILSKPASRFRLFKKNQDPFPWICIQPS
jgi:ubiquinone/menaquinone biosynthesis C-methylase UbiE